ncbi:ATP-binding protein [Albidovulum sp.]
MIVDWFKRFLPRGLYGRAALILILPIVTIQLVVSIAFIQRHFEDVTEQMTESIAVELDLLLRQMAAAPDAEAARQRAMALGEALGFDLSFPAAAWSVPGDGRVFYDLSGRVVIATLHARLAGIKAFDLSNLRRVRLLLDSPAGPMEVEFNRRRVSASNPHQLLVLMIGTSLLMTLIAFFFLRNQLRPIRRLARAAEAFGKGQVVPYRPAGALEVRAAGRAFLEMRARIERQIEQRTLLLSGVSHDLRTPLTRLRLGLSMLGQDDDAADMIRDVEEMERLLDGFLAFVRADHGDEDPRPADPVELVRMAVEDARRGGQAASLHSVSGGGTVVLRPQAVRRALQNLIGNAVRYGRRAEVSVTLSDRSCRITVEDDGPGIPPELREEAVKPFTRLDSARNQNLGSGVGLGLAITADIARSHGGELRLGDSARLGGLKAELILAR